MSRISKAVLLLFFSLFQGVIIRAGYVDNTIPKAAVNKSYFKNLRDKEGVETALVTAITQDKYGFIWLGTYSGVFRYDGSNAVLINSVSESDDQETSSMVSALYCDNNKDILWVGTRDGFYSLSIRTLKINHIDLGHFTDVRTLYNENDSILWVGTQYGLLKFNKDDSSYVVYNKNNRNLSNDLTRSVYKDASGNLWVGTLDMLNVLYKGQKRFESFNLKGNYAPKIHNNLILNITPYSEVTDSLLWVGTGTGLILFNRYTKEYKSYRKNNGLSNNKIIAVLPVGNEKVWIGTDFGLNLLDVKSGRSKVFFHDPFDNNSLTSNAIRTFFRDISGVLWIGTYRGVNLYDENSKSFEYFPVSFNMNGHVVGSRTLDICEAEPGVFWIGTQRGVLKYSTKKGIIKEIEHLSDDTTGLLVSKTLSIYFDKYKRLWIATNKGLNIWDSKKNRMYSYPARYETGPGLKSQFLNNIIEAKDGSFWISTWDAGIHRVYGYPEDIDDLKIKLILNKSSTILTSSNDAVWSVINSVLYRIDLLTNKVDAVKNLKSILNNRAVISIIYSDKGVLWMGGKDFLAEYEPSKKQFKLHNIIPAHNYEIINLIETPDGNIWGSTETEILKYAPKKQKFEFYPIDENSYNIIIHSGGCCRTRSGELVFTGDDGFVKFDPDKIYKSNFEPEVYISELYLGGKKIHPGEKVDGEVLLKEDIPFEKEIWLNYSKNTMMLNFASTHYFRTKGNFFSYKLDGIDDEWRFTSGDKNFAVYSHLPPGRYLFKLKGTNNDGVWSDKIHTLKIMIRPPIWARWPFIVLYLIVLSILIWAIIYFYKSKQQWLLKLNKIRLEKEKNEKLALAKQRFFINISHEFRTPLSLIIGPANELARKENITGDERKLTTMIVKNANRLMRLVNQILDFRKLEVNSNRLIKMRADIIMFCNRTFEFFTSQAEKRNIKYSFTSNIAKLEMYFDKGKMEMILYNLLSNAFNFTPDNGSVSVVIHFEHENDQPKIHIKVIDSGIGIKQEETDKIFERFYQSERGGKVGHGTGIGLTIVKEYVEMHDGTISVKSAPDKGAEFEVVIPVKTNIGTENVEEESSYEANALDENIAQNDIAENKEMFFEKHVILIVEDDSEVIDFIRLSLKNKYDFIVAHNGKDALKIVEERSVDLVISDVMMPEMNGYEFLKKIKYNPKTGHIPVILLSAKTLTDDQIMGVKSGADAYLTKPFDIKYLEAIIENQLSRRELLLEHFRMQSLLNPSEIELTSVDEKILKQVITFIETHISDPDLNIKLICNATGYTHSFLYRKIKQLTGETLNELIREIRIKRAAQLLKTGKFTVAEVMMEVGFSNHSYFSKCFRKIYNTSPGSFLNND